MPRIIPHLWFDTQAAEAARLYISLVAGSRFLGESLVKDTPSGDAPIVNFELGGQEFQAISAGPYFRFTPAVSFHVACADAAEVDALHARLIEGGSELMPLGSYPFSPRYSWLADRYGLSWQLMDMTGRQSAQKVTTTMMFTGANAGRAEEAIRFYASVIPSSSVEGVERYGPGMEPDLPDMVKHADFSLAGLGFAAMDSARDHGFAFNEAISLMVICEDQAEIDRYWQALSAVPEAERCGWLKDRYGFSWQIVPAALGRLMSSPDEAVRQRVTRAFLAMGKLDIAELERVAG